MKECCAIVIENFLFLILTTHISWTSDGLDASQVVMKKLSRCSCSVTEDQLINDIGRFQLFQGPE